MCRVISIESKVIINEKQKKERTMNRDVLTGTIVCAYFLNAAKEAYKYYTKNSFSSRKLTKLETNYSNSEFSI